MGAPGAVETQVDRAAFVQPAAYWYTVKDCQRLLLRSRATIFRKLPLIPPADKVMVKRHITDRRTTRYWRISPNGLRILGHSTGQAPYL
jgi:hypothetical protein